MSQWAWVGDVDASGFIVCARVTSEGALSAVINGTTYPGETIDASALTQDIGGRDGVGRIPCTGLAAGTEYEVRVFLGDVLIDTVWPRTVPSSGIIRVMHHSCVNIAERQPGYLKVVKVWRPHLVLEAGDTPYADFGNSVPKSYYGETGAISVDFDTSATSYLRNFRIFMRHPDIQAVHRLAGVWRKPNDHEIGNNWDHTESVCNSMNANSVATKCGVSPNTPAEVFARAMVANDSYARGNPVYGGAGGVRYFSKVLGFAEVFWIDEITGKSPFAATDNASKYLIDAVQEAWLLAGLSAAKAAGRHCIIASGYSINTVSPIHSDSWYSCQTQLARIENYIINNEIPCFWLGGDHHHSRIEHRVSPWRFQLHGCSMCGGLQTTGAGYNGTTVFKGDDYTGDIAKSFRGCTMTDIDLDNDRIIPRLIDEYGQVRWGGRHWIERGANVLRYAAAKVA